MTCISLNFFAFKAKLQSEEGQIFRGFSDALQTTVRNEGILGLYKGLAAVITGGVPGVCLYLTTYDLCKDYLLKVDIISASPFLCYFTSGLAAEAACCILFVPVDVVKERLQIQSLQSNVKYKGSLDAIMTITKEEGLKGLYKGYNATLIAYGPFSALYFYMYEKVVKYTYFLFQLQY